MSFKKSNIYFDEKPIIGSKNAITSGAVAENSSGIPIYKVHASMTLQNPEQNREQTISGKISFDSVQALRDFANKYVCIGVCNLKGYLDESHSSEFPSGNYIDVGIVDNVANTPSNSQGKFLHYTCKVTPNFSVSNTTVYYSCDLVFVDVADLTDFE